MIKYICLTITLLSLAGCNPEMGRLPLESDVHCLKKELSSADHMNFQMAANFCQRSDHGVLQPLQLKGHPDLQEQAQKANIAYIQ